MQNTFSKAIDKHQLQFNRYLYPLRYTVKNDEFGSDGKQYEIKKNGDIWCLSEAEDIPEWLSSISVELNEAIEKNEKEFAKQSVY
jgi:hypothetical protein